MHFAKSASASEVFSDGTQRVPTTFYRLRFPPACLTLKLSDSNLNQVCSGRMPVMWRVAAGFARNVAQWIYPNSCLVCDAPEGDSSDFRHGLCNDCFLAVMTDPFGACPWCAKTIGPHTDTTHGCA